VPPSGSATWSPWIVNDQQLNVDAIDADRSHRDRLEPRDRYLPRYSW